MKNAVPWALVVILAVICIILLSRPAELNQTGFLSNQEFIEGLYNNIDLSNEKEVFRYVFSQLNDKIVIYPTENYYYFRFPAQGKIIFGSLSLPVADRDEGYLRFSYAWQNENPYIALESSVNGGAWYGIENGISVVKKNDFHYAITFEGRTVDVILNDVGFNQPQLRQEEVFVGPIFDESGLRFFLVFDKEAKHLFHILNEDDAPEQFKQLNENVVVGERTGFAFYDDKINNRKVLIGVRKENILQNNWYDGPFDQMPDNYVKTGQIPDFRSFMEESFPELKGKLDEYGAYLEQNNIRVAPSHYAAYSDASELSFIEACKKESQFYSCISKSRGLSG